MSNGFYIIDDVKIEIERSVPNHDVRFMPQKKLVALNTPATRAELTRREAICEASR